MGLCRVETSLNIYHGFLLMLYRILAALGDRQLVQVEAAHALPYNFLSIVQKLIDNLEIEILCRIGFALGSLGLLIEIELFLKRALAKYVLILIEFLLKLIVVLHELHALALDRQVLQLIDV